MPVLKAFLLVEGKTILDRGIEVLSGVFDKVVISTNMPEQYFCFGLPMIGDVRNEKGPMIGILSVLVATGEDAVFFVACDMPFLNEGLIRYMKTVFEWHREWGEEVNAVIPASGRNFEPLFGIYTRHCVAHIERMLSGSRKGLVDMIREIRVITIPGEIVRAMDPECRSFINLNTFDDYKRMGLEKGGNNVWLRYAGTHRHTGHCPRPIWRLPATGNR
jgi:molybdenum cofactor guanylyltransferase